MTEAPKHVTLTAVETPNLDVVCYRGSAPLRDLTIISQADVFDQVTNPDGLQRDLSRKHAAEVYDYAAAEPTDGAPRAFPEVVLNVRDRNVVELGAVEYTAKGDEPATLARLTFDVEKIGRAKTVKVSRVDGNHRLYYGMGDGNGRAPLDVMVPFQIHVGLTREQEASLFLDINATQKGLNTSHLLVLRSRLTPEDLELERHPERVYALRLAEDAISPWCGLVHLGGSKSGTKEAGEIRPVSYTSLVSGVRRILTKSQYLPDLSDPTAKYGMIRNYWKAVQATWPEAWEDPRAYYCTANIGVQALSSLGATVIDRAMAAGQTEIDQLEALLAPTKDVYNWSREATTGGVSGMSGNRAALLIAGELGKKVPKLRA